MTELTFKRAAKASSWALALAVLCFLGLTSAAQADEFIYGNNASFGPDIVYQIDLNTGAITNQYDVSSGNGRGVVVVGNIMYTTNANSNNVYAYNLSTNTNLGVVFSVAGSSALSTMAFDGTNFWIGDYSGTNHAYEYSITGTLLKTISLGDCTGFCDGLEYLAANGGELISNEGDAQGPYDVYDLNGNLLHAHFIDPTAACGSEAATGIAFDGTQYLVSCIFNGTIGEYDINGHFTGLVTIGPGGTSSAGTLVEDLSANYQQVLGTVPEPSSVVVLMGFGLAGLAAARRRKKA